MVSWYHEGKPRGRVQSSRPALTPSATGGTHGTSGSTDTTTELTLRLHLHRAGLRLRSSGVSFEILSGNQVLLSGNAHGEALSIDDVAKFFRQNLVRP
jgi:hypothetical protein